jgi:alpha-L-fucosidase
MFVCTCLFLASVSLMSAQSKFVSGKTLSDSVRAGQISDMKFGMFICWSFSTFSGKEWTGEEHDPSFFQATSCNTDQWAKTAKEAGMNYVLFLTKHHDGFCLWDTKTTDMKVTNSPLKSDVLKKLQVSCRKYGIKLAIYFSEGDWTWSNAQRGKSGKGGGSNPEIKKAQLKELLTKYGQIEFIWFDHAAGDGGLSHKETTEWVSKFQPNCFVGYNHGEPSGRLCLREMGKPGLLGDSTASILNKDVEASYKGYHAAEFTYPILPNHKGGASWFYSLPIHDNLCKKASQIYSDYINAVKYRNIFSLDIGPDYTGNLRAIDIKTLKEVGQLIRKNH